MPSLRFRVTGVVQGVGFRYFATRTAEAAGVCGWVRNTSDGAVEGEACGETEALDRLIVGLNRGPRGSRVEQVLCESIAVANQPTSGEFVIIRTR